MCARKEVPPPTVEQLASSSPVPAGATKTHPPSSLMGPRERHHNGTKSAMEALKTCETPYNEPTTMRRNGHISIPNSAMKVSRTIHKTHSSSSRDPERITEPVVAPINQRKPHINNSLT